MSKLINGSNKFKAMRNSFAEVSTSSPDGYYPTKGDAIQKFDRVLQHWGYMLSPNQMVDYSGNQGRAHIDIVDSITETVSGIALLTWYRMPSGRYEFIGYIA